MSTPILQADALLELGVPHAFSTRVGGTSPPPFDSFNFGNPGTLPPAVPRDTKPRIARHFAQLATLAGAPARRIEQVHQVHAGDVRVLRAHDPREPDEDGRDADWGSARADALASDDPTRALAVRTADCAPVLLASRDGRAVAAVHAGWRGVIAGVLPAAIDRLRALSDTPILAAVGPCIGAEAFEVGEELREPFERAFPGIDIFRAHGHGKGRIDLRRALQAQLLAARVFHVEHVGGCTFSAPGLYFSHRRDRGITGRHASLIAPRARR